MMHAVTEVTIIPAIDPDFLAPAEDDGMIAFQTTLFWSEDFQMKPLRKMWVL